MYICDFTRAVGVGRAMCLNTRGLVRSVIRRIVPPLPARVQPSNTMQTLAPEALTHSCMATSSPCRTRISFSYSFRFIFPEGAPVPSAVDGPGVATSRRRCFLPFADFFFLALPIPRSSDRRVGTVRNAKLPLDRRTSRDRSNRSTGTVRSRRGRDRSVDGCSQNSMTCADATRAPACSDRGVEELHPTTVRGSKTTTAVSRARRAA